MTIKRLSRVPRSSMIWAVGLTCLVSAPPLWAEPVAVAGKVQALAFDIPGASLSQVLLSIVRQSRTPISFDQTQVEGLSAPAIKGSLSVDQALEQALRGSGLGFSRNNGVLTLHPVASAPAASVVPRAPTSTGTLATVVVTGTRQTNVKASESLSPIDVVSSEQLQSSGATDLRDMLVKLLPALTRQAQPFNASALTHTQSLRGLSPDHVLVLVNGKRRHETANLNISGGLQKGSTGVDLDTIPVSAIERIEVLRDGASAQYGSDAIAGVINIILKSADHGALFNTDIGQYGAGDGLSQGSGINGGLAFGESGFLNLSAEYREQERTVRSGIDNRTGHRDNISIGDPAFHRQSMAYNSGYGFDDDVELYSFGTYTSRKGSSAANYRLGSVAPTIYPQGFTPRPNNDEDDYSAVFGIRGNSLFDQWHWDLSTAYGADRPEISMTQSVNAALYRNTGTSPTSFDLATYRNTQWTNNFDIGRAYDVGFLAKPLNVALGLEQRRETYQINAGDPASYDLGGAEGLAGLSPLSAGKWSRDVLASYIDLSSSITEKWQVDVAGRYEHFSEFGSTTNGKLSTRYDFTPAVAVRASVSSGFRAPSLVQEHYTGLSVGPDIALGLLAANSPAAKLLGAKDLKPEKSTNFNLGLVLTPRDDVSLNIDAYQIRIRDRIVDSGTYSGTEAIDALTLAGISLPAGLDTVSTHYLANGADTLTRGVDITGHYLTSLGAYGAIDWEASANFNRTKVEKNHQGANGDVLLNAQQIAWLTSSTPRSQVSLGSTWSLDNLDVSLRLTRYGKTTSELDYTVGPNAWSPTVFNHFVNSPKYITDVAVRYAVNRNLQLSAGADNVLDVRPDKLPAASTTYGDVLRYDTYGSQIGFNGAFYYVKARYQF
ncbi:iron complex outermembrane recepter protein [Pseudomonas synxantha]|uniref:Outer membrane receptor protein n=1 Tax=Pseudomonas synxantha TaxID=47883 RepID=A0AAX3I969_9PSED|nr:TonB-dependent receptor [Pseudomonas synxantha]KRP53616.1 membrane protein [Pseudomonas synxantha]SDU43079.1 iron complex outermembrane recepter protein [Pseudomonas synxantha]VTR01966.1 outer membrane receptor protein [Pseudomonas synxantha]